MDLHNHTSCGVMVVLVVLAWGMVAPAVEAADQLNITPSSGYTHRTHDPGHSYAAGWATTMDINFRKLDTNDNNVLSRSEADQDPALKNRFQLVDVNGDQQISPAEFNAFEVQQMRRSQAQTRARASQ